MGQTIKSSLSPAQRRTLGYVNQQPFLLAGSVADNIALALKLQGIPAVQRPSLINKALQQVNLVHLASQTANTLSGGELKRAAIARAIAHEPQILLLDEPFSHLDQSHIQQLETILETLASQTGSTVIFSTHDRLQGAALANTTINLINGKITKSPILKVFHGHVKDKIFDTGKLQIHTTSQHSEASHIAIDPHEIIISTKVLDSSMRNHFSGRLTAITEENGIIHLTIDCRERFYAIISPESLSQLGLSIGNTVCLSFKSTAVSLF
jgi:molybdopterin-binding protein